MSAEFTTEPPLTYDQILASRILVVESPARAVYAGRRHAFLRSKSGDPPGRLTLFESDDGRAGFERFGTQNEEILALVAEEFGVRVIDEHGLVWPEESDG